MAPASSQPQRFRESADKPPARVTAEGLPIRQTSIGSERAWPRTAHRAAGAERTERNSSMNQPVTTLDERFSDEHAVATSWAETRRALEGAELFWISTVRADGRPHVTPLVAVWLDDAIYFATGPAEQKALNLRGNPHVILTTGCNRWDAGLDVVVEGNAAPVSDDSVLGGLAQAWGRKWDGR